MDPFPGIAVGLMVIGVMGHITDAFAYVNNEKYALEIIKAANRSLWESGMN